ncbi:MAG TPA: high-affinity branched-chain amino acid ABC transporter permease LivM [Azospirillaceae bacterium]|nr:high-affinity branched-chain amino acid ABC transporter permease LivM [Azospirillaceae bacterium]
MRTVDWPRALKDAALAALIALAVALPMVGMRTVDQAARLTLDFRLVEVVSVVVVVFVGRLILRLTRDGAALPALVLSILLAVAGLFMTFASDTLRVVALGGGIVLAILALVALLRGPGTDADQASGPRMSDRVAAQVQRLSILIGPLAVAFAIAMPFLPFADRRVVDAATFLLTYIMLGWGLNIVVGLAGLLDLGYVAFYAVGAYAFALLAQTYGLGFWEALPLTGLLAALSGIILGFPVLRLRGDYFAIVTLGFGEIIRVLLLNWSEVTGGPNGIGGIPRPDFFGFAEFTRRPAEGQVAFHDLFGIEFDPTQRLVFLYYVILALALVVNLVTLRLRKLPLGRAWEALREDDIACTSLGINRRNVKLAAFAISAMFGGFAGAFFATRQGFISPESFTFIESAIILAIVVLGGMGSQTGVVVATLLIIGLPEVFRELSEYRMLAFGVGMVLIMLWRPSGLLAHREPTLRLHPKSHRPEAAAHRPEAAR